MLKLTSGAYIDISKIEYMYEEKDWYDDIKSYIQVNGQIHRIYNVDYEIIEEKLNEYRLNCT